MHPGGSELHTYFVHTWRNLAQRVREQSRPTFSWTLRLTVAATAAYIVATLAFDHQPLLAPLSALLVTQITLYSVVRHGIQRVVSVVAGVLVATVFASVAGLSWWSLAVIIAISLMIGQLLRLRDHVIEVPVTAMFVMAVQAGTTVAAYERVTSTLIGAAVGLLINILIPPSERSTGAAAAIRRYGEDIAKTIENATSQMDDDITQEQTTAWLANARALDYKTIHIDRLIDHAEEARVLNIRAINTPNAIHGLRTGLYALEHSAVTVRGVFRGISDAVHYPDDDVEVAFPEDARLLIKSALDSISKVVAEFGNLVEAHLHGPTVMSETALLRSQDELREVRKSIDQRFDAKVDPLAVRELLAFVIVAMGRILREFDVRSHAWLGVGREIQTRTPT